ncbi:hypothetical protein EG329_013783 [Mollisiaceae sp. DMI_Dod_QoI]|nr:hypothetical protein EG329_013783 [Helotiales sp. DMI_Dod_QoI]
MSQPLTFGIEFEFLIASIISPKDSPPEPAPGKVIRFPRSDGNGASIPRFDTHRHIVSILQSASFPAAQKEGRGAGDYTRWGVTGDSTVEAPEGTGWDWIDVEVVSPIFQLTQENLETVRKVCALLRKTYKYHTPRSSGLHVHIGDGDANFSFETIQNLITFLWAFEPQLNTLHPIWRIDSTYCLSMRNKSAFAERWYHDHGERPLPLEGVLELMKPRTMEVMCDEASPQIAKYGAYNFLGVKSIAGGRKIGSTAFAKPTVEFRQHMGTLSGEAAIAWIKTVGGIVQFAKNVDPITLHNLLSVLQYETWEKLGANRDPQKEKDLGPTLAESRFTAVDLFQYIGLTESAEYYRDKMYDNDTPVFVPDELTTVTVEDKNGGIKDIPIAELPVLLRSWDYETNSRLQPDPAEYARKQQRRKLWEAWKRLDNTMQARGSDRMPVDLESKFWPSGQMTILPPPPPDDDGFDEFGVKV